MTSPSAPGSRKAETEQNPDGSNPSVPIPPAMAEAKQHTADEILEMMNRTPLFMTTLDETDGEGGENVELEALKALAYEGTKAEVAGNFREQGNECARAKNWTDARDYYTKSLAALKAAPKPHEIDIAEEPDPEAERKKELAIEEACYSNRALANLEKQNYRSCVHDCASALRMNPFNVKAWYRSGSACLALDRIPEAEDACNRGLEVEPANAALKSLALKISARKGHLEAVDRRRREREERKRAEESALGLALKGRNIPTRTTPNPPNLEDAVVKLAEPLDPSSTLSFPVLVLYPAHAQSDFVKAFEETQTLGEHLSYMLPLPWDEGREYTEKDVDCYVETVSGGLIKAGKKLPLGKILSGGKVEVVDGLLSVNVVPRAKAAGWVEEFKKRRPS